MIFRSVRNKLQLTVSFDHPVALHQLSWSCKTKQERQQFLWALVYSLTQYWIGASLLLYGHIWIFIVQIYFLCILYIYIFLIYYIFVSSAVLCDPVGRGLTARVWRYKKQTRRFHQPNPLAAKNVVNPLFDREVCFTEREKYMCYRRGEIYVLQNQRNTFEKWVIQNQGWCNRKETRLFHHQPNCLSAKKLLRLLFDKDTNGKDSG